MYDEMPQWFASSEAQRCQAPSIWRMPPPQLDMFAPPSTGSKPRTFPSTASKSSDSQRGPVQPPSHSQTGFGRSDGATQAPLRLQSRAEAQGRSRMPASTWASARGSHARSTWP